MGATDAARPVPGQLEARFLAQVLDAFHGPGPPNRPPARLPGEPPPLERASTREESRPRPGAAVNALRSACSWASRSTSTATSGAAQIWPRSAQSSPAASGPS